MISSKKKFSFFLATLCLAFVSLVTLLNTKRIAVVEAANLANFKPGNIMSDSVMSNYASMSEADIQTFLKSKNHCNDRDIHKANWYPHLHYNIKDGHFVCMADEDFSGESAAHIIWQAAHDYKINPQAIIVLLQKEQGLITDTWPNHIQYRSATGFGCPDTAACDTQYYGLKNQIRNAASLFRTVLDGGWSNYPVGWNNIQYNPNPNCGSSSVYIENRATSALYRYTPYQPNQAALAAGWGTAPCGAYGNRNFYLYFTNWFGETVATLNEIFPRPDESEEQLISNGDYRLSTALNDKQFLDVREASMADYAKIQLFRQWSSTNKAQMWQLVHLGDNFYTVASLLSGKYLSFNKNHIANGERAILLPKDTNNCSQRWKIKQRGDKGYTLASACDERQVLDVAGALAVDENPVQIWKQWGDDNYAQVWKLEKIENP